MSRNFVIGTRESELALVQSNMVLDYLKETCPEMESSLLKMKTTGDMILDRKLDEVGGKGLFVKELDKALAEGRTNLSVHSLKDLPMEVSEDLPVVCYSKREDPRDVLVLPVGVQEIDFSRPIGTSSKRRILQLQKIYPQAVFETVRGNVQTRLRKLDEGQYSALVLSAAGLKRLGLSNRISKYFSVDEIIPAAGQGILALQGRSDQSYAFLKGFGDENAEAAALAERAFVRKLDGGCTSPVAAHAIPYEKHIFIRGLNYDETTGRWITGCLAGHIADAEKLGEKLADRLIARMKNHSADQGKVYLVGAGPGDVGLFTLKGKKILEEADVVVYDALVGAGVLSMIPEHVRTIDVGKRASHHTMPQEEINQVLLREAQAGNLVVRLKGGDPFLFGRGGEELELLSENNIPFEVVPGVTSSLAVPAYNGIPVTHRDYTSSLHIITGHKRAGKDYDINFKALADTRGTLVFLMGVTALPDICKGLLDGGMDPDMPAAVLQQGTTAGQKRILATVSTLAEEVKLQGVVTPAIIVVGKVCELADSFTWYERLPLQGFKVVVTRPKELVSKMSRKLRDAGAEVLELPAIATKRIENNVRLYRALDEIDSYDWIVFTSPTGVKIFFRELLDWGIDHRSLSRVKFAVIGEGSKKELMEHGFAADLMPKDVYDVEHLGEILAETAKKDQRILIPRAKAGNDEILRKLDGFYVDDIPTYDTVYESWNFIDEKKLFESGEIGCVAFTSASTVKGFMEATKGLDYTKITAACIGKQTKAAADAAGMKTYMSNKATMDSLVELITDLKNK